MFTNNDIASALSWFDCADLVVQLSEKVTFSGGDPTKPGHVMLLDLVDFIID